MSTLSILIAICIFICIVFWPSFFVWFIFKKTPQLSNTRIPLDCDVMGIWIEEDRPMTDDEFAERADMIFTFKPKKH